MKAKARFLTPDFGSGACLAVKCWHYRRQFQTRTPVWQQHHTGKGNANTTAIELLLVRKYYGVEPAIQASMH